MLTRRICITIKSFISWQSLPLHSQPWYVIQWCYSEEKSDPSDSYSILLFLHNISLFVHFYMNILLIMVIELSWVHSARLIWNHKYDFRPKLHGTRFNYQTSLHPFWNRPNTGLGQFQNFIDAVLSWFEIKFIHFLGEKQEFWKQRLQNFPHDTLCLLFSSNYIGYFKQALKSDWLFCFQCSLLNGWENDVI